ncbi:serine hydrolase [Chryseobacterium echinoideorum]|uniref:serine hydrolase n=1 Tax=Chryseobacterium echinoideorum TaxID=1549648 RepID=UPI001184813C|nr:serine hydrolase domain-containing protein [Chryseobacterium echinoideorum]
MITFRFPIKNFFRDKLTSITKKIWAQDNLSGRVLVAQGDQIIYENYRGFARENNQKPIDKNTPLHVVSVSKTLTARAMMKLLETGKIKLSDVPESL